MATEYTTLGMVLSLANVIIAFFILVFAYIFLKRTEPQEERKPWMYLFIAVCVFFLFEVVTAFNFFGVHIAPEVKDFFKTFFIALVLYVFVFQHFLIMKSNRILIKKKKEYIAFDKVKEEQIMKTPKKKKKPKKK